MSRLEFKFINDHTGKEVEYNVIGVWVSGNKCKVGLAIDEMHCINELYVNETGYLHLSRMSIGPTANEAEIEAGKVETPYGNWYLIRMSPEEIRDFVRNRQIAIEILKDRTKGEVA